MANLPAVVKKLDDIAEPLREFYVQAQGQDGTEEFRLLLEGQPAGYVPRDQHHKSIENGRTVAADLEKSQAQVSALEAEMAELAKKLGTGDKGDKKLPDALAEMEKRLLGQIETLKGDKAEADTKLRRTQVASLLKAEATKAGVTDPNAQGDLVALFGAQFDLRIVDFTTFPCSRG